MPRQFISYSASLAVLICGVSLLAVVALATGKESFPVRCAVQQCGRGRASPPTTVLASNTPSFSTEVPIITASPTPEILKTFTSAASFAVDDASNEVLWDVSSTAVRPLASITKLMSALVLLDLPIDWSATTTITEADSDGSQAHIKVGESYSLATLWQVALIGSSNTAISALARMSGLSPEEFVGRMNAKARRLAMPTLHFVEPTGLNAGNQGTARDVVRLLRFALQQHMIVAAMQRQNITVFPPAESSRIVWSTNWLLTQWIPHVFKQPVLGKTGYIDDSGYNFTARLEDAAGHKIRLVVLGAAVPDARFTEARSIGEWVFKHVAWPSSTVADAKILLPKNVLNTVSGTPVR